MADRTTPSLPAAGDLSLEEQVRLLSGRDHWHTEPLPERGVPSAMVSDGPHGLRAQHEEEDHLGMGGSEPATCFPTAVTLACAGDPDPPRRLAGRAEQKLVAICVMEFEVDHAARGALQQPRRHVVEPPLKLPRLHRLGSERGVNQAV